MNIDNLIKELQQINVNELTYSQLGDLAENIEKLKERMAVVLVAKCLAYGEKFFEDEEQNNELK